MEVTVIFRNWFFPFHCVGFRLGTTLRLVQQPAGRLPPPPHLVTFNPEFTFLAHAALILFLVRFLLSRF